MRPTRIREIKMKKQLFIASALTIALTSQAQILTPTKTTSDGIGYPIPGMFTCDGKGRMSIYSDNLGNPEYDENDVRIYNENLELEKNFKIILPDIGSYSVIKRRELVWNNVPKYDLEIKDTVQTSINEITVDNIRWMLGQYSELSNEWTVITETSRTATSVSFNVDVNKDLLNAENYGGYFSGHYYIGTITCSEFDVKHQVFTLSGTLKCYGQTFTGDWNEEKTETSAVASDLVNPINLEYNDMTSLIDYNWFNITQSLFNKDEAYEYIVPIRQQIVERIDNYDRDNDGEVDEVDTRYGVCYPGFKIMQDNGNVLATIMFDGGYTLYYNSDANLSLLHFENKDYIAAKVRKENNNNEMEYATIFYTMTPGDATSIKAVRTEHYGVKATPALAHKNETVVVDFSGIENAKQLSVVNGNGRTVMHTHVTNGKTSYTLNTSNLPAGLYVVKVYNGKHTTETCKIVVR